MTEIPEEIQNLSDEDLLSEYYHNAIHLYICDEQGQIDLKEERVFNFVKQEILNRMSDD